MAKLFSEKFVRFLWKDELAGKSGFFSDNIADLIAAVNEDCGPAYIEYGRCEKSNDNEFPFHCKNSAIYQFFYYDPLYKYKKAYLEGKTVQIKDHIHNNWQDIKSENVLWGETANTGEYRIKLEEPKVGEKKYRPFKNVDELVQYWDDHYGNSNSPKATMPMIWVKSKQTGFKYSVFGFSVFDICVSGSWESLNAFYDKYEFLDNTPCGVEEQ